MLLNHLTKVLVKCQKISKSIKRLSKSIKRLSKISNNDSLNHLTKFYLFLKINNLQSNDFVFIAAIKY